MKSKLFLYALAFALMLILPGLILGQIPQTLSYQGVLSNSKGEVVVDDIYYITFKLYSTDKGGSPIWSETQSLAVKNGLFNTALGSAKPLDLPFDQPYWLSVTIGDDAEARQRMELTASAYSLHARSIADSIVTGEKIAKNQVVRGINSITDNVNLVAGENVMIKKEGHSLIISATTNKIQRENIDNEYEGQVLKINSPPGDGPPGDANGVVRSLNDLTGHLTLKVQGGASITTDGDSIITINAGAGTVGEINNTNNTLGITNPNGPTTTINVKNSGINTTQLADGAVTTPKLAADAVTSAKIADGTVSAADIGPDIVSSIDGVSNDGGNIDLVAGANITITPDDGANKITISSTAGADNDWTISGNNMFSAVSGNVGIGTTGPGEKLDVSGNIRLTGGARRYEGASWVSNAGTSLAGAGFDASDAGFYVLGGSHLQFVTSGTDRVRIDGSGNVGIGTTSPTAKLHISGTAGVDGIKFPDGTLQTTAAFGGAGWSPFQQVQT